MLHPERRLTPLTDAEYAATAAIHDQHEPAKCPVCTEDTTKGWLYDQGCCYSCSAAFDRKAARVAKSGVEDPFMKVFGIPFSLR